MSHHITLAILVGGASRRMGTSQDKGLLSVHGEALVYRLIRKLSFLFQEILIICSSETQKQKYDFVLGMTPQIIVDESGSDRAAYYGLCAALKQSSTEKVLVIPVDAQGVDPGVIKKLLLSPSFPVAYENTPFPSVWLKQHLSFVIPSTKCEESLSILDLLKKLSTTWIRPTECEDILLKMNLNTREDVRNYFGEPLCDSWGRQLNYLRLSLTESCNMACQYCLPKGFHQSTHEQMLTQTAQVILKAFRKLGFEKVRFTGGEPTLHPGLLYLISDARSLGYETISLTTNGSFIQDLTSLIEAGLTHINISLDTLDPTTFQKLTGSHYLSKILGLIDEALEKGLNVKLNTVLLREINLNHIEPLLHWAKDRPLTLRFIELMPIQNHTEFFNRNFVSNTEIQSLVRSLGYAPICHPRLDRGSMEPLGPAVLWSHPEFLAKVGFISPWSCNFCDRCNRLRVTARAHLRLCLFGKEEIKLPAEQGDEVVSQFIRSVLHQKPLSHDLEKGDRGSLSYFKVVGG